jgi:hypothetical protein
LVTQINEFAQPVEDIQSIQQVATISSEWRDNRFIDCGCLI